MELDVGDSELVDRFHPLACSVIEDVGSRVVHGEIEELIRTLAPPEVRDGQLGVQTVDRVEKYAFKLGSSRRRTWEPDVELLCDLLRFEDEIPEHYRITVPLAVRARLSDVPELEETEEILDEDLELMKLLDEDEAIYPAIVTVCLDDLPSKFRITDVSFVSEVVDD